VSEWMDPMHVLPAETTATAAGPHPRRWFIAVVLIVAALMDMLDATVVNVALPSIGRDLHATDTSLQWTVSAYMLGFAATLVIAGHLGDRYGHKRLFLTGVACFGVASLGCALSQSPAELIAGRAVQGVAAAVILPQVLATFRTLFHGKERGSVFGLYGAIGGFASAIGILAGGVLVNADLFGLAWRTIFLVNLPIAALVLVAAGLLMPATAERATSRLNPFSSLLLVGGLVAIVLPLSQGRANGWPLWGWICLGAGLIAVIGVGVVEANSRSGNPLLPVSAFRIPAFSGGLGIMLLFALGMQGFFLVFTIWLQYGQNYTPLQAGIVTTGFSAGTFITAPAADALTQKFGRRVLALGALLMSTGIMTISLNTETHTGAWPLIPGLALAGAGLGLLVVPLVNVVLSVVPIELAGAAGGIFSTAQQFGGALGVALIGNIFFAKTNNPAHGLTTALTHTTPWAAAPFLACAALCTLLPRTKAHTAGSVT
jgi:EmrB/QacA subfamily drug resistance transporter